MAADNYSRLAWLPPRSHESDESPQRSVAKQSDEVSVEREEKQVVQPFESNVKAVPLGTGAGKQESSPSVFFEPKTRGGRPLLWNSDG